MSGNIDLAAVQRACMADLSRIRQEELPLSEVERRGPSYAPGSKTGAAHISKKQRTQLHSKWGGTIDDEESRQLEGLRNEESRPWAKKSATDDVKKNKADGAPSKVRKAVHQPAKATRDAGTKASAQPKFHTPSGGARYDGMTVQKRLAQALKSKATEPTKSGLLAKPTANIAPPSAMAGNPAPATSQHRRLPGSSASAQSENRAACSQTLVTQSSGQRKQPGMLRTQDQAGSNLLVEGPCRVLLTSSPARSFEARYKVQASPSGTLFGLSALGKGERVHPTSDLEAPELRGLVCSIRSREGKGDANYHIQLPDDGAATDLIAKLGPVRNSPVRGNGAQDGSNPDPGPFKADQDMATLSDSPLIDIAEDEPTTGQQGHAGRNHVSIGAAAQYLTNLVSKTILEITQTGCKISELSVGDIREGVAEKWTKQGLLSHKDEDERQAWMNLLDSLVRVRLQESFSNLTQSPNGMALAGELIQRESEERTSKLQYTVGAMKSLEPEDTPPPKGIEAVEFPLNDAAKKLARPKHAHQEPRPVEQTPAGKPGKMTAVFSSQKAWLNGNTMGKWNEAETDHVAMGNKHDEQNEAAIAPNDARPTETSIGEPGLGRPRRGLAQSRWATPTGSNSTIGVLATKSNGDTVGLRNDALTSNKAVERQSQVPNLNNADALGNGFSSPARSSAPAQSSETRSAAAPAAKGLSHSRFATSTVEFSGRFTGVR